MCRFCCEEIADDFFDNQMDNFLLVPQFIMWNNETLKFFIIASCSRKEMKSREKCITLLENYLKWRKHNTKWYIYDYYDYNQPRSGFKLMPYKSKIQKIISKLKQINLTYDHNLHPEYVNSFDF